MTIKHVTQTIKELIGRDGVFGAQFVKSDGSVRTGSFRLGVKKGLATSQGAAPKTSAVAHDRVEQYDPEERGLLVVWDMNKGGYRSMYLDRIERITVRGHTIEKREDGWYDNDEKI